MALEEEALAGYSGTPLARKLGIKAGWRVLTVNAPPDYLDLVEPVPEGTVISTGLSEKADMVHFFTAERAALETRLPSLIGSVYPGGPIWVSWPKKASGVATDITEDTIREIAIPLGLVDVKVCAVDSVWSGLRLVLRKEHRTTL